MWAELQTPPTFSILIGQMIHYSSIEVKNIDIHVSTFCVLNRSLTAEHKASYSLVFSDIKYQQNIAGR